MSTQFAEPWKHNSVDFDTAGGQILVNTGINWWLGDIDYRHRCLPCLHSVYKDTS